MKEIWKSIVGYENIYSVSNLGNVKRESGIVLRSDGRKRTIKEKVLKLGLNPNGYPCVQLCKDGEVKMFTVHRLVAVAFIENPNNYNVVNHLDSNPQNNCYQNLEWTTMKGNTSHSIKYGSFKKLNGSEPYPSDHPKLVKARELIEQGVSMRKIAKDLHICRNVLKKHGIVSQYKFDKSSKQGG